MGIDVAQIKRLQAIAKEPTSLDAALTDDDDTTVGDLVADNSVEDPADELFREQTANKVREVLLTLDEREQEVMALRYGLGGTHPKTLDEIGKIFGVTKERIRQIENKALRKLRNPIRANMLKPYLEV